MKEIHLERNGKTIMMIEGYDLEWYPKAKTNEELEHNAQMSWIKCLIDLSKSHKSAENSAKTEEEPKKVKLKVKKNN